MGPGRAVWLPLVAALVGAGAGVAAALVVPEDPPAEDASSFNDPLVVGAPLVDLECTGEAVLVLGYGSTGVPLRAAVVNHPDEKVRYLRTDQSCPTLWAPAGAPVPDYVAYTGPFEDLVDPCRDRLSGDHPRDDVTRLSSGNTAYVACVCEVPTTDLAVLTPSAGTDPATATWVRSLQRLLVDLDAERADGFRPADVTGILDPTTRQRIEDLQRVHDIVPPTGVVDEATWSVLTEQVCPTYTDY